MGGFVQNMGEYGRLWELWEFYGIMGGVGSLIKTHRAKKFGSAPLTHEVLRHFPKFIRDISALSKLNKNAF